MTELLPCVEIDPPGGAPAAVVWLHGLGADGHDFEPVVPHLRTTGVRFVFPHAPRRPVTINGGLVMPAWYDVTTLGRSGGENERHVRESGDLVRALLEREERNGVRSDRLVVAGFSQGAAIALFAAVRYPRPLAGVLVLSGYEVLPEARGEAAAENTATPMLFGHGVYDPLVPVARGRAAHAAHAPGREALWREYPIEHSVSMDEIEEVGQWLRARLP